MALFRKLSYDPTRDFAFVTQIAWSPAVVTANPDVPVRSMQAFNEGIPEHRDLVLSPEEHAANQTMMICCSGAKSGRLVLDL